MAPQCTRETIIPHPATPIILDEQQRSDLTGLARSRTLPHRLVQRAQIVLACADGEPGTAIAERMRLNKNTLAKGCTTNCARVVRARTATTG